MMLIHMDSERALDYLSSCIDQVNSFNEILQLVIVELVYKVSTESVYNPTFPMQYILLIFGIPKMNGIRKYTFTFTILLYSVNIFQIALTKYEFTNFYSYIT